MTCTASTCQRVDVVLLQLPRGRRRGGAAHGGLSTTTTTTTTTTTAATTTTTTGEGSGYVG